MSESIITETPKTRQIQTPPYTCPRCGAAIREILHYTDNLNPRSAWKPLDDYAEHLHYLNCTACDKCTRVARLGDAVLPFDWPENVDAEGEARTIAAVLAEIVQRVGPQGGTDPAASIVYRLLASTLAPEAAIREIRALVQDATGEAMIEPVPVFAFQEVTP